MDLRDIERNTRDHAHASLAGAWIALVARFGGMRHIQDTLSFSPRLPKISRTLSTCASAGGCCGAR